MSDIDTMPAGPELDRLVAERVMGFQYIEFHPWDDDSEDGTYDYWQDGERVLARNSIGAEHHKCAVWQPSTNNAHAIEVLVAKKAWEPRVGWNDEVHAWFCDFEKMPFGNSAADTIALAICRALLRAVLHRSRA